MILLIDENIPFLTQSMSPIGKVVSFNGRQLTNRNIIDSHAEILITRSTTKVTEELLEGTKVKLVATATSGTDHVDTEYLKKRNIEFGFAPGSNANSVAEYVIYSICKWLVLRGLSFEGLSIGIIGYGNIGRIVAGMANRLGMKVILNDPPLSDSGYEFPEYARVTSLQELVSVSDIITNHVPLQLTGKYKTTGLIGPREIDSMKAGSLLIQASRGGVVDEAPLLRKLRNNHLFAAIDVWENEPCFDSALAKLCLIASPHIAGYSREGKIRGAMAMAHLIHNYSGISPDYSEMEYEMSLYKPIDIGSISQEALTNALRGSRSLDDDTERMLGIAELSEREKRSAFDALRKTYPVRHEIL